MTDETGFGVLTDAQWADRAALIEQCPPPHKTEHKNLRRPTGAIIWRHENGAKWRSIPPHLGPWWMAAQTFIRWSHHGVWERLLELAQQRDGLKLGMAFLDGTTIRAPQQAAGAIKKGETSAPRDKRGARARQFLHKGLRHRRRLWPGDRLCPGPRTGQGTADGAGSAELSHRCGTVDRGRPRLFLAGLPHADLQPRLAPGHPDQAQRGTGGWSALDLPKPQPRRALLVPRAGMASGCD